MICKKSYVVNAILLIVIIKTINSLWYAVTWGCRCLFFFSFWKATQNWITIEKSHYQTRASQNKDTSSVVKFIQTFLLLNLLTSLFSGLHFGIFMVFVTLQFLIGQGKQGWIRVEQVGYKSHIQLGVSWRYILKKKLIYPYKTFWW